ncbi:LysR family transcriptional regulator [Vibrio aestuarianus]|uniref:LysR family transcriptional regulator n=1 Tax=Vibrio aestuarianus TaxID=28171 RepID=A0A9X4IRM9_9VIBR|nr:LysR family transcriptional regulator [Vibrio aestuarianus]MDE1244241.1 LysR family transcriptional regulator [Vibrio aestuarianus]MDE1335414.1 LysR family transcriptional regulator [Vibrio aestuarianus]MDE1351063.1 LysR family transcriptional regulator [Vibrio aestuarianus]
MKTEDIKMFHHIVESGGLVKASELLDLPKSNLSRRLKALEHELGIDLFHRQHKTIVVSENGRRFYQTSKTFLEQFEIEIQGLSSQNFELSGHIRIQILALPNLRILANIITDFMSIHPKVTIEIITSSTEFELIEKNVDIGFRIGYQLESMDLIARKLLSVDLSLYASPQYLEQYGTPQTPMDLELHEFILFRKFDGKIDRRLNFNNESVTVSGRLIVNDVGLLTQSCLDHQGISCIADHDTQEYVENGKLVKLLPNYRTEQVHGWLLYPRKKTLSRQAKALIDYILERFPENSEPNL